MKFLEILQDHHIPVAPEGHHHARPGWVQFDCPYCASKGSRKWHMGYNISFGYVNCWRCGRHKLLDTLADTLNLDKSSALKLVKGLEFDRTPIKRKTRGKLVIPPCVGELEPQHKRYLKRRGFDPQLLSELWGLGGIGLRGAAYNLAWRLFIPIHLYGEMVSWTTRSLSETTKKKYRTATEDEEAINHHELLYGADYCRGTALVFEGPPDVWRVGPGALCTFGTQWSMDQLFTLSTFPRRVICYDNEQAAQKRARQLAELLALYDGETFIMTVNREGRDFTQKQVDQIRSKWL